MHRGAPLEVEEIGEGEVVGISKDFYHVGIYLTMVLSRSPVFWDDQQSRWKDDSGDGNSNDEEFAEESVPSRIHFEGPCS